MAVTEEASSRSEATYLDLRQKLLRGEFTPNYRLKLSELCAQRGVSVSVVREALTRLAEQGLIQSQPNKGFYIPNYTVEEINDLAFLRSHIEALAIRLAIQRGDAPWEASVVAAHHELRLTPRVRSSVDPVGNQRWSRPIPSSRGVRGGVGSPRLVAAQHRLYDEAEVLGQMTEMSGRNEPRRGGRARRHRRGDHVPRRRPRRRTHPQACGDHRGPIRQGRSRAHSVRG